MAQRYRRIDPRIWRDEKFVELEVEERLLVFDILTGQTNRIGYFSWSMGTAAEHTGMERSEVEKRFATVIDRFNWCFETVSNVLLVRSWWTYNPPANPNVLTGNLKDLHDLPRNGLLEEFIKTCDLLPEGSRKTFTTNVETFRKRLALSLASGTGTGTGKETKAKKSPPAPEGEVSTPAELMTRWNAIASVNGLPPVRSLTSEDRRYRQYLRRMAEHTTFWEILNEAVETRADFYRETNQPDLHQATRRSYFAEKILDRRMCEGPTSPEEAPGDDGLTEDERRDFARKHPESTIGRRMVLATDAPIRRPDAGAGGGAPGGSGPAGSSARPGNGTSAAPRTESEAPETQR